MPHIVLGLTLFSAILLDQMMTKDEMQATGVATLNPMQKAALEAWIDQHFVVKEQAQAPKTKEVYLSVNIDNGKKIRLTDGSLYEIYPPDVTSTAFWITPFPVTVAPSNDPNYPYKITNGVSGTVVKAKQLEPPSS